MICLKTLAEPAIPTEKIMYPIIFIRAKAPFEAATSDAHVSAEITPFLYSA